MDYLASLLPPAKGYLPYYMLTLSLIAVGNSMQNYITLHYTRRMYAGQFVRNPALAPASAAHDPADAPGKLVPSPSGAGRGRKKHADGQDRVGPNDQVTPLAARLFGTYTFVSAVVRLYASYNLHLAPMYQLALWTYVVAMGHFASEFAVFRTAPPGKPVYLPFFFATVGIVWMTSQYSFYVEA